MLGDAGSRDQARFLVVARCAPTGRRPAGMGIVTDGAPATVRGGARPDRTHLPLMTGCTRPGVGGVGVRIVAGRAVRVAGAGALLVALATRPLLDFRGVPGVAIGAAFVLPRVPAEELVHLRLMALAATVTARHELVGHMAVRAGPVLRRQVLRGGLRPALLVATIAAALQFAAFTVDGVARSAVELVGFELVVAFLRHLGMTARAISARELLFAVLRVRVVAQVARIEAAVNAVASHHLVGPGLQCLRESVASIPGANVAVTTAAIPGSHTTRFSGARQVVVARDAGHILHTSVVDLPVLVAAFTGFGIRRIGVSVVAVAFRAVEPWRSLDVHPVPERTVQRLDFRALLLMAGSAPGPIG